MAELQVNPLNQNIHLLPLNATIPEKVLASLGVLVHELDDPISRMWNPHDCPVEALPFLAWALNVPLWDEAWPETKKRSVLAETPELNSVKGTVYAVSRYVEIMDGRAVDFMLPPSGIYLSEGDDEESRQDWLSRFAEVRLYDRPGADIAAWSFLSEACLDDRQTDDGIYLAPYFPLPKRRAELHDRGTVTPLEIMETRTHASTGATHIIETFFARGFDDSGFYLDQGFDADPLMPERAVLLMSLENGQVRSRTAVDFPVISNRPVRVVQKGEAVEFFSDVCAIDIHYLEPSFADRMIFESWRIYDPARSGGTSPVGYCLDDPDYFNLEAAHMLVDIDARHPMDARALFLNTGFVDDFYIPDTGSHRARLFAAAASANPTSDKTLVSTTLHRPVRFSDGLPFGSFEFGQMINSKEQLNA